MMNKAVKNYFSTVPEGRKKLVDGLHAVIVDLFPDISIDMRYKMPTYHLNDGWVALANQKNYVSIYTCGYHHIKRFKDKHPKIKTGKGCINFKERDPLPIEDLRQVVKHAIEQPKSKA